MSIHTPRFVSASVPAASPPPGIKPNFTNPHSDGPILIALGAVFLALALLFVAARIYAKSRVLKKWSQDDCRPRP